MIVDIYGILIALGILVPMNLVMIYLILKYQDQSKIKLLMKSKLSEHLTKVLCDFKDQIKVSYLKDGRIKLSFPIKIMDKNLEFYIYEGLDGNILISDFGELMTKLDMNKTPNKTAIRKACGVFGAEYNSTHHTLSLDCSTRDTIDEAMWQMLATMLIIEYATY